MVMHQERKQVDDVDDVEVKEPTSSRLAYQPGRKLAGPKRPIIGYGFLSTKAEIREALEQRRACERS